VSNVRDSVNIKLSDATAAELAHRPIEYDTGFTLLPGKYRIKFLARDDETGRIGTYETTFTIPNLNKEDKRVPISSVVLSSQRVEQKDTLFDAAKAKEREKEDSVNPLSQDGKKIIPSVTRVFSTARPMFVYLQAYKPPPATSEPKPSATPPQPLFAFVSLYLAGSKVFETLPAAVEPNSASRLGITPLNFSIALDRLPPGTYDCQVTVLDPSNHRTNYWRAPVLLVQ
jgi:hypothetical protein